MWRKLYCLQSGQSGKKKNSCPWQESNASFDATPSNYTDIWIKKDIKIFSMREHGGLRYDNGLTLRRFQIWSLVRFLYWFSAKRLKPSPLPKIKLRKYELYQAPSWSGAHTTPIIVIKIILSVRVTESALRVFWHQKWVFCPWLS
jgi:hypothetical protein